MLVLVEGSSRIVKYYYSTNAVDLGNVQQRTKVYSAVELGSVRQRGSLYATLMSSCGQEQLTSLERSCSGVYLVQLTLRVK